MEDRSSHKSLQAFNCCQFESSMASAVEEKSEISFEGSASVERKKKIMNMIQVYLVQLSSWIAIKYPFL